LGRFGGTSKVGKRFNVRQQLSIADIHVLAQDILLF
jgi:hypothetical protein